MVMQALETESKAATRCEHAARGRRERAEAIVNGINPKPGHTAGAESRLRQKGIVDDFVGVETRIAQDDVKEFVSVREQEKEEGIAKHRHQKAGAHLII